MVVLLIACLLPAYLWRLFSKHNPWPRIFLGGIAWISGVDVTIAGERSGKGAFLLANHVSWIDIPAIGGATGAAFVAHDGLASVPLIRSLCALNDTVFVARHDRASVARQIEAVREAIRDTGALAIFPEGTTSDGTGLLPFKSSLLSALDPVPPGIAVQPVWLDYGADANEIAWVGDEPGLANFMDIMARSRPIRLTVHFLPPLDGDALAHRKTMAEAARRAIIREMEKAGQGGDQRVAL
ncbi:MAG: 1-acyl-sn-glycerol-3-phosphate acyltransferase [Novosphingobium sp.]|nr:1-acyl-sn-glycerol-3-phosphate acyltransferase [Novosphingobium sp.]MCP5403566.1 1-acyl-sn-glycerol-3-phosphate acyltransferase [Novosphingobium sp.]